MHLLTVIQSTDWVRDAVEGYDILEKLADKVDVIGHSNGGSVALILTRYRNVNKLILTGPNLFQSKSDKVYKDSLKIPLLNKIIEFFVPLFEKPTRPHRVTNSDTLDPIAALSAFHYPALPINSLKSLWALQDQVSLDALKFESLYLLYGKSDESIDIDDIKKAFNEKNIKYTSSEYENSGHNILEDYDKDAVAKDILKILTDASF